MERDAALSRLLGTWRLVSVEARGGDGAITLPYGREPVGYLTYTAEGRMAVSIMRAPASRVKSGDLFLGAAEALGAGHAYIGYSGTVTVEGDTVVHTLDTCSYPNWVGTAQRRRFLLEGDRLTLTTPPIERGGTGAVATVIWVRLQ
jgi:hypothetical protein